MSLHSVVAGGTARIVERSRPTRAAYPARMAEARETGVDRPRLSCGNLAHGFAAAGEDKPSIRAGGAMNVAVVTAYNDMLHRLAAIGWAGNDYRSLSACIDEKAIVDAAIHLTPEALGGGAIARPRDGDAVRVCGATGTLAALVPEAAGAARAAAPPPPPPRGTGREPFAFMRHGADEAEKGASAMLAAMAGVA